MAHTNAAPMAARARRRRLAAGALAGALTLPGALLVSTSVAAVGPCGEGLVSGDANRLGNLVFRDADGDGLFEPAEGDLGLGGIAVELWLDRDADGSFEPGTDDGAVPTCTATTDADGHYWFSEVSSGSWFVAVDGVPSVLVSSEGAVSDPSIDNNDNGAAGAGYDAVAPIFVELMENQPRNETPPGGVAGADEARANATEGFIPDDDSNLTIDFGFTAVPEPPAPTCVSVGNRVWLDVDGDGLADDGLGGTEATESGIDGVAVELRAIAADGSAALAGTTTTSNGGYYLFDCVSEGEYRVVVPSVNFTAGSPLEGLRSTVDRAERAEADRRDDGEGRGDGSDGDIASRVLTLTAGTAPLDEADKPDAVFDSPSDADADTTVDFGFAAVPAPPAPTAALGDFVWSDVDGDGTQDAGEPGVSGVELVLVDPAGVELSRTTTDADGRYGFTSLPAGTYAVCVEPATLPNGATITGADAGDDDAVDSDIAPDGTCTPLTDLADGETDLTLDLGIVPAAVRPNDHDAAISKTGVVSGDRVVWTITVSNNSSGDTGPIQITDPIGAGIEVVSVEATGEVVCVVVVDTETTPHQTVECHAANLAPSTSAVITLRTTRPADTVCSIANTATVETAGIAFDDGVSGDTDATNDSSTATVGLPCGRLPVTGTPTGLLAGLAVVLAGGGTALLAWVGRTRPVSIADRLG